MKRVFLLAHPAGHSISPAMHNAAFKALNISAHYEALDVAPEQLSQTVEGFRQADVYGSNVTTPHKLAVKRLMDELTEAAKAIGAVNTIINQDGKLLGHNTDATGYIRALKEDAFEPKGKHVLILGAGGAARAVVYALLKEGVASLSIYNRTTEKAEALAQEFEYLGKTRASVDLAVDVFAADLLVNTTSVGMQHEGVDPSVSPLADGLLPERGFVSDIIYRPSETKLLRDAKAKGLEIQNGLAMLIYQGAESFECWTGQKPDASIMFQAARRAIGS